MLSILLVTTHRCNLRCKYCYEAVSHGGADMTVEDARSAFRWNATNRRAAKNSA